MFKFNNILSLPVHKMEEILCALDKKCYNEVLTYSIDMRPGSGVDLRLMKLEIC